MPKKINADAVAKACALSLVAVAAWMTYLPKPPAQELAALSKTFAFDVTPMANLAAAPHEQMFAPRLQKISAYLEAFLPLGTAFADFDGNGKSDEVCLTDPFLRKVTLQKVPYKAGDKLIELDFSPLPFDGRAMIPSGCLPGDFNEDGQMDLIVSFWGRTPVLFTRKIDGLNWEAMSHASFTPAEVMPGKQRWYTQSITAADVDGDGHLDVIAANYFPDNAKILNDDSKGESLMNKGFGKAQAGARNRLLLGHPEHGSFTEVENIFDDNLGGEQWTQATAAIDFDGDQLPEILFINDHGPDRLLLNQSKPGHPAFRLIENTRDPLTPKSTTLGRDAFHGMGVDFADLNHDGAIDWVVPNFGANYLFHQSHFAWMNTGTKIGMNTGAPQAFKSGHAPFVDRGEDLGIARTAGIPWDVRMGDFNNDGQTEIYMSVGLIRGKTNRAPEFQEMALFNDILLQYPESWHPLEEGDDLAGQEPNTFFAKAANGRYVDIGGSLPLSAKTLSRGASVADIDGDGHLDMVISDQRAPARFLHNIAPRAGNFLGLDIRLPYHPSNPAKIVMRPGQVAKALTPKGRQAVGAAVLVHLPNEEKVAAVVDGGSGAGGKRDSNIHIGLGSVKDDQNLLVEITWRDSHGNVQTQSVHVKPGWHTLWLGSTNEFAEVRP